jgi:hypothetical protein
MPTPRGGVPRDLAHLRTVASRNRSACDVDGCGERLGCYEHPGQALNVQEIRVLEHGWTVVEIL